MNPKQTYADLLDYHSRLIQRALYPRHILSTWLKEGTYFKTKNKQPYKAISDLADTNTRQHLALIFLRPNYTDINRKNDGAFRPYDVILTSPPPPNPVNNLSQASCQPQILTIFPCCEYPLVIQNIVGGDKRGMGARGVRRTKRRSFEHE